VKTGLHLGFDAAPFSVSGEIEPLLVCVVYIIPVLIGRCNIVTSLESAGWE